MAPEIPETSVLRALASPARRRILDQLGRGPATSAMLARALDSNTGVMSYHLRELGKAGLIAQSKQQGRQLYWRLAVDDIRFRDPQDSPAPHLAQAAIDTRLAGFTASVAHYLQRTDLSKAWRDAALFSEAAPSLTAAELGELTSEYLSLIKRWSGRSARRRGARTVRLALFAFPDTPEGSP